MTDGARMVLLEARRAAVTDYVVEYGGRKVGSVKGAFKAAAARACLPSDNSPHILRHSAAVHMAESGISMSEIAQFLSHTTEKVTFATYARYSPPTTCDAPLRRSKANVRVTSSSPAARTIPTGQELTAAPDTGAARGRWELGVRLELKLIVNKLRS